MEMNKMVSLGVTMGYKVVNSMSTPLQEGNTPIVDLSNDPEYQSGIVSCAQVGLKTSKFRVFSYFKVHGRN